jgi:hypothetical protein
VIPRRSVLLAGGIGLLVAHRLSRGQPAATIRRVGMLSLGSEAAADNLRAAFPGGNITGITTQPEDSVIPRRSRDAFEFIR